jgi:glycosyltransferase involved in cell wall biosynthesis
MNFLVSVICLTYNTENYISKCIQSVIEQSYTNWELIIIDDFSQDMTQNICKQYMKIDSRIKLIIHKKNWGINKLVKSYNQGLKLSKGKYVSILEGDDYWPKHKLESQIKDFKKTDIVLSYGDVIVVNQNSEFIDIFSYGNFRSYSKKLGNRSAFNLLSNLQFSIIPATLMIEKKFITQIKGFQSNLDYPIGVDIPTLYKLSLLGDFYYHSEILAYYRKHIDSVWFNTASKDIYTGKSYRMKTYLNFCKLNLSSLGKTNIKKNLDQQKEYLYNRKKTKLFWLLKHYVIFRDKKRSLDVAKKIIVDKDSGFFLKIFSFLIIVFFPLIHIFIKVRFYLKLKLYLLDKGFQKGA